MADKYLKVVNGTVTQTEGCDKPQGAVDAGKLLALNTAGEIDSSLLPSPRRVTQIITDPSIKTYPLGFTPGMNTEIVAYNGMMLNRYDDYVIEGSNIRFVDDFILEGPTTEYPESKFILLAVPLLGSGPALMPVQERDLVYCVTWQGSTREVPFILKTPFKGNIVHVEAVANNPITTDYAFIVQKRISGVWQDLFTDPIVMKANEYTIRKECLLGVSAGDEYRVGFPVTPVEDIGAITIMVHVQAM